MPAFDRLFNRKRWAAGGGVSEPSDAQANQGFSYLPNGKPTVEGFNALFQMLDDKDIWNYGQVFGVLSRAGMAPTSSGDFQLADAIRALRSVPPALYNTAGSFSYTVPASIARVLVFCTGAGGGSTACDLTAGIATGAGGGAGATSIGFFAVNAQAQIPVTVGAGGGGGGVQGGTGGSSSFGSFCSATGGAGGVLGFSAAVAGGGGGVATGGLLNLGGGAGSDGHPTTRYPTGYGGASFWGGQDRAGYGSISLTTAAPGGGGGPRYLAPDGGNSPGVKGGSGLVLVVPLA